MRLIGRVEESEKNPLFLMGDLNEWREKSKLLKYLNEILVPLPCKATFPSFLPVFKLDRAWHDTPEMNIKARVLDTKSVRKLSDHLPVMVEISY